MSDFKLDTSGYVQCLAPDQRPNETTGIRFWSDLSPFVQGYIVPVLRLAAQQEIARRATEAGEHQFAAEVLAGAWDETNRADIASLMRYDRLAPETLARIIEDCRAFQTPPQRWIDSHAAGGAWWADRQKGNWGDFPPPAIYLGDDGKVRFK